MNFDNEKQMAKEVQNKLHGTGPVSAAGRTIYDYERMARPSEPEGSLGVSTTWKSSGLKENRIEAPTCVPDAERMIGYLDRLSTDLRSLAIKAGYKLDQFANPDQGPKPVACDTKMVDQRLCSSSYFRILESRVEMMQESIDSLRSTLDSVSATEQSSPVGSNTIQVSNIKSY